MSALAAVVGVALAARHPQQPVPGEVVYMKAVPLEGLELAAAAAALELLVKRVARLAAMAGTEKHRAAWGLCQHRLGPLAGLEIRLLQTFHTVNCLGLAAARAIQRIQL